MYFPVEIYANFPVPKLVAPAGARYHGTGAGAGAWDIPNSVHLILLFIPSFGILFVFSALVVVKLINRS
jgi:hypothetical protein